MSLLAISDLHVGHDENRELVEGLRPSSDDDWLLVAGDVAERIADVVWAMELLRSRFRVVVWAPGNHELWTPPGDPIQLRGEARYQYLVSKLRELGVLTPEDPYPLWHGPDGPVIIAPLFVLYDHTFKPLGTHTKEEALAVAYRSGVVSTDEHLLHPDPFPSREAWCENRLAQSRSRLKAIDASLPTVLVNHFPLLRAPTQILHYPEFAQWCGTAATADWHIRYRAQAVVYGHLHIPRTIEFDGVPHHEVSLGYPREWRGRPSFSGGLHRILPAPAARRE